jgi:dephospho-CoA kinase
MIFIGVTGGIGSGKSLLCSLFEKKNILVFKADEIAKEIPSKFPLVLKKILETFGAETVDIQSKTVVTKKLAEIVFEDPKKLESLNSILHPIVFDEFKKWKEETPFTNSYALTEAALLLESGMDELVDYTLAITANHDVRIKRVQNKFSPSQFEQRSRYQLPSEEVAQNADFVITNEGSIEDLQLKADFFHTLFLSLTKRKEEE